MLIEMGYGEAALALGFVKLLRGQLPRSVEMQATAQEVARWLFAGSTEEEQREIRQEGFADLQI